VSVYEACIYITKSDCICGTYESGIESHILMDTHGDHKVSLRTGRHR
jgi:hypothetical protein